VRASGETRLAAAVDELLLQRRPAGTVVVISDFLVNEAISKMRSSGWSERGTTLKLST